MPPYGGIFHGHDYSWSLFSHCWFAMPQLVLQADWQEVWHSPQPPFFALSQRFFVSKVWICFIFNILRYTLFCLLYHILFRKSIGNRHFFYNSWIFLMVYGRNPLLIASCKNKRSMLYWKGTLFVRLNGNRSRLRARSLRGSDMPPACHPLPLRLQFPRKKNRNTALRYSCFFGTRNGNRTHN